jgi:hypothetical protein
MDPLGKGEIDLDDALLYYNKRCAELGIDSKMHEAREQLGKMDRNDDKKISKQEYMDYFMVLYMHKHKVKYMHGYTVKSLSFVKHQVEEVRLIENKQMESTQTEESAKDDVERYAIVCLEQRWRKLDKNNTGTISRFDAYEDWKRQMNRIGMSKEISKFDKAFSLSDENCDGNLNKVEYLCFYTPIFRDANLMN